MLKVKISDGNICIALPTNRKNVVTGNEKHFDVLHCLEESNRTVHCPISRVSVSLYAFATIEHNSIFSGKQPYQYAKIFQRFGYYAPPHIRDVPVVW